MSYRIARFGWLPDPLDNRDRSIQDFAVQRRISRIAPLTARGVTLPAPKATAAGDLRVDLRPWCSPIENQGQIGSCTANAVVGAIEYFEKKTRGVYVDASRFFLYRVTRRYLGWDGRGDTGAFVRSTIKALRLFGVTPEAYWPYDEANFDAEPQAFHYSLAQNFKALEYFRVVEDIEHLKSVLDSGLPFAFGFTVFSSIDDPDVAKTGVIPYPSATDEQVGGHAILAVGYTDSHVLIRNSWGESWGLNGYGFLPWTYFDQARPLATDSWVLVNASWIPADEADQDVQLAGVKGTPKAMGLVAKQAERARSGVRIGRRAHAPLIQVSRGIDPVRSIPLRLTATGVMTATGSAPTPLDDSAKPAALYLRTLELRKSFDFALFGDATNELYVTALTWDLSGAPPRLYPPANIDVKGAYLAREGDIVQFVGDGIQLWPMAKFKGGLYVRLLVIENDDDVRAFGERLKKIRAAVDSHKLIGALAALAAGPTAALVTAVGTAAAELVGVIGDLLGADGDDLVALFDGTYGAESVSASRIERYEQMGAAVELEFKVGSEAKTTQTLALAGSAGKRSRR